MSNMVSTTCLLDPKTFSQNLAMGWLTYIGVRAQRLGSSLGAVFTLGEPPDLHPWLQDAEAWLPKRTSAAIAYASKSLKKPQEWNDEGNSRVCKVLRLLTEGSTAVDHPSVEGIVEQVVEQGGDKETAGIVLRAAQSGRLDLPLTTLARILEAHERLLADLVETFLVEGLQSFEANLRVVSAPATLASVIASSQKLYTQTLDILQAHLVQMKFDTRLLQLFQVLTGAILASASNIPKLFPPRQRALVILLQAFDAFHSEGQGEKVAEEILCLLATEEQMQSNVDSKLLKDSEPAAGDWSLENRLLLLQFPHVLPHLSSLTHLTH